jgi:hypothetical protein
MGNEIVCWKVEPIERSRRGLDERLLIVAPRLLRLGAFCLRRPAGSRLRRVVITHLLQVGLAANNRGDYKALSIGLHPDVELDLAEGAAPELEGVHRGRDAFIQAVLAWKGSFGENRWEPREIFDPGGARFGFRSDVVARGTGSGVELRRQELYVCELEDGLLRRQWFATNQDAMLRLLSP